MKLATSLFAALILSLTLLSGCVTSKEFQLGANQYCPDAATEALAYANADTTLDAATKAQRVSRASALKTDTSTLNSISRPTVTTDWQSLEAWYLAYVDADPNLDARAKTLRHSTAAQMDAIIASDAARPLAATKQ